MNKDGLYWAHFDEETRQVRLLRIKPFWLAVAASVVWMLSVMFTKVFGY